MISTLDRFRGCLLGLAIGDAIGTSVEFSPRGSFAPITDMTGGGPFGLRPGEWTDDTSMALCLAHSLLHRQEFDAVDQMNRYCNWRSVGYMSSTGVCFDVGITTAQALDRYLRTGDPFAGDPDPRTAGNGALMRLAPVPMFYFGRADRIWHFAAESTRTTHGAQEAIDASRLFAIQIDRALHGASREEILSPSLQGELCPRVRDIAEGTYREKTRDHIHGTGYCVEALEAALWCFRTTSSFEAAVLEAANLGDDADTTAAICGQIAGAFYGEPNIPERWRGRVAMSDDIVALAERLYAASSVQGDERN